MKFISITLAAAALALAACNTTPEQNTMIGAVGGAAVGHSIASDGNKTTGALIGAAAGAVAGSMVGQHSNGQCRFADGRGGTYIAPCP